MNSGDTKTEAMLNVLGNGGSGDQFRGCCNTKTQSYILDAIDRINNLDPGGGVNVVQTKGTSTTDVMSQDATTKMIYPDVANYPNKIAINGAITPTSGVAINGKIETNRFHNIVIASDFENPAWVGSGARDYNILIGNNTYTNKGSYGVGIGYGANITGRTNTPANVSIGYSASTNGREYSVALGGEANCTRDGEVNIGTGFASHGYNNTAYRVIGGVHDGVNAHDAATVGQLGVKILTAADYNYDSSGQGGTPDSIALWTLDNGWYITENSGDTAIMLNNEDLLTDASLILVNEHNYISIFNGSIIYQNQVDYTDGSIIGGMTNPDGSISPFVLDLADYCDMLYSVPFARDETPSTSMEGTLGQLFTDTTTMHTYQCTAIDDSDPDNILFTWTQRW